MYYLEYVISDGSNCSSYCITFCDIVKCFDYYNRVKKCFLDGKDLRKLVYIKVLKIKDFEILCKEDF